MLPTDVMIICLDVNVSECLRLVIHVDECYYVYISIYEYIFYVIKSKNIHIYIGLSLNYILSNTFTLPGN